MTEPSDIAALAAAIADLLNVPHPKDVHDRHARPKLLEARADVLRGVMLGFTGNGNVCATVESVRWIAEHYPATYPAEQPEPCASGRHANCAGCDDCPQGCHPEQMGGRVVTTPSEHGQPRKRCGMPCLTHPHDCDRSPGHTGVHRDVQQKGDHSCEWETPRRGKDVPALLAIVLGLQSRIATVEKFCAARAEFITAINNCHPDNYADYHRWQGHAEGRRQLSQELGLPVAWPPGYEQQDSEAGR